MFPCIIARFTVLTKFKQIESMNRLVPSSQTSTNHSKLNVIVGYSRAYWKHYLCINGVTLYPHKTRPSFASARLEVWLYASPSHKGLKRIKRLKDDDYRIQTCPYALILTVPLKHLSKTKVGSL